MSGANKHSYLFSWVHLAPEEQIDLHQQPTWELSYVITGSGMRLIGNMTESFSDEEVILIPPEMPHCWYFDSDATDEEGKIENITLTFANEFLEHCSDSFPELSGHILRFKEKLNAIKFDKEQATVIIAILKEMCGQSAAERIASIIRLIIIVADSDEQCVVGKPQKVNKGQKRMNQIHTYVICNFKRAITLDDVARHVGMNRASFCIFFRKSTGKTFITYLNEYRIEIACQLLKQKKMSVSEICYYAGFNNVPYFNRVFKSNKGVSPGEYSRS